MSPRRWACVLAVGVLTALIAGCGPGAGQKTCGTLDKCQAFAVHHFGRQVLVPQGPTFLQGATERGVLGLQFQDPQVARSFSLFVGHAANRTVPCPGKVVNTGVGRTFCFGSTKNGLMSQFFDHGLLYTLTSDFAVGAQGSTPADEQWMTHIVAGLA